MSRHTITVTVNGEKQTREVEARLLLVHFLRENLELTGTHVGCDTTSCGACTVSLDGQAVKSCTVFAVQADGAAVETIEGVAKGADLHALQQGFWEKHGLQCGFCTPGMIMSARSLLRKNKDAPYKFKPSDGGLPSYLDQNCGNWCYLPQMGINGYSTVGITGTAAPAYTRGDTVQADLYHNRGNHSIRAGIDFRRSILSAHAGNNDSGYTFGNNYFRQCDDNCGAGYVPTVGKALAEDIKRQVTQT